MCIFAVTGVICTWTRSLIAGNSQGGGAGDCRSVLQNIAKRKEDRHFSSLGGAVSSVRGRLARLENAEQFSHISPVSEQLISLSRREIDRPMLIISVELSLSVRFSCGTK